MRIAIVTDAWSPQVNGVVRTLQSVRAELEAMGHAVLVVAPADYRSVPCPTYPEIRLALARPGELGRRIGAFGAEAIHLATEGPLCLAARHWAMARGLPFTTAYHTQFPDYVAARTGVNPEWVWHYIRWFHAPAMGVMASTPSVEAALRAHGLARVSRFGRGVDLALFGPEGERAPEMAGLPGPVMLYVGRVAVEKNIEAFLAAPVPGTKVVVGDGPARADLAARFPDATFLGPRTGASLAACYRSADVFVFPSRTDTFGLVMIEALASGVPVAAYPVMGPVDVLHPGVGAMADDLSAAIRDALGRDRATCAAYGRRFTWRAATESFLAALAPLPAPMLARAA